MEKDGLIVNETLQTSIELNKSLQLSELQNSEKEINKVDEPLIKDIENLLETSDNSIKSSENLPAANDETLINMPKIKVDANHVLEWKKQFLKEGHSIPSTNTYYSFIKRFVDYETEINQKTVDIFRRKNMCAPCSGALKSFFQFLVYKQEFPDTILNIRFDRNKTVRKFPKSLPYAEIRKLIDAMPTIRDRIMTLAIYELGLRISESLKLLWEDFSWTDWIADKTKQGSVNLKNTKGGKFRTIPVSQELMALLYNAHGKKTEAGLPIGLLIFDFGILSYLQEKSEDLEQKKYNYIDYAKRRYRKILNRISETMLNKKVSPHQLRHSRAQDMMNKGVPIETIKAFLGHARISSTEIYAQASAEKLKADFEVYNQKIKDEQSKDLYTSLD